MKMALLRVVILNEVKDLRPLAPPRVTHRQAVFIVRDDAVGKSE